MSDEYQCIMLAAEEKILLSETVTFVFEGGQILGTHHAIPCPGLISDESNGPIMQLRGSEAGEFRHEMWKRMIGKK